MSKTTIAIGINKKRYQNLTPAGSISNSIAPSKVTLSVASSISDRDEYRKKNKKPVYDSRSSAMNSLRKQAALKNWNAYKKVLSEVATDYQNTFKQLQNTKNLLESHKKNKTLKDTSALANKVENLKLQYEAYAEEYEATKNLEKGYADEYKKYWGSYPSSVKHSGYTVEGNYLEHHGIMGMHWGIRRFQPYGHGGYNPKQEKKELNKAAKSYTSILDKDFKSINNVNKYSNVIDTNKQYIKNITDHYGHEDTKKMTPKDKKAIDARNKIIKEKEDLIKLNEDKIKFYEKEEKRIARFIDSKGYDLEAKEVRDWNKIGKDVLTSVGTAATVASLLVLLSPSSAAYVPGPTALALARSLNGVTNNKKYIYVARRKE